jgi:probable rRNA maturation factor
VAITNRHPKLQLNRASVVLAIHTLDTQRGRLAPPGAAPFPGELSLVFLRDSELAQLHAQFLADPTPTDVITFPGDAAQDLGGEICVSVDTARNFARAQRGDFARELTLYLVHGWLHLAGHDDLVPAKKRAMRRAEARALEILTRTGTLPAFGWKPR